MSNKSQELTKQIKAKIEYLANLVDEAEFSSEIQKYFKTVAKFHKYSPANQWLIMFQKPTASHVAGYNTWKDKFNRQVRKGEKGIQILAPMIFKNEDENGEISIRTYFKVVSVFDISQTDGEELKELDIWKTREKLPELEKALTEYAKELGLTIQIDKSLGGAEGMLNDKKEIHLLNESGTKTLAHEIAHYLAEHLEKHKDHKLEELEAEATAHIVCDYFGLQESKAPNYLYLTGLKGKDLKASLELISELSRKMITAVGAKIK